MKKQKGPSTEQKVPVPCCIRIAAKEAMLQRQREQSRTMSQSRNVFDICLKIKFLICEMLSIICTSTYYIATYIYKSYPKSQKVEYL